MMKKNQKKIIFKAYRVIVNLWKMIGIYFFIILNYLTKILILKIFLNLFVVIYNLIFLILNFILKNYELS